MAVADLVFAVAERGRDAPVPDVPAPFLERMSVAMSHKHLSALAGADLVDYDRERKTAAASARARRLRPLIGTLIE